MKSNCMLAVTVGLLINHDEFVKYKMLTKKINVTTRK